MRTGVMLWAGCLFFILLVDALFFRVARGRRWRRGARLAYGGGTCLFVAGASVYQVAIPVATGGEWYAWTGYGVMVFVLYYLPRAFYLFFYFPLLLSGRRVARWTARGVAVVVFLACLQGMTVGRYDYQVVEVPVRIRDLPAAFEGTRVVQLTDLHLGSHGKRYPGVRRMVDMVNALDADVVVVTGDVVNNFASELWPWVEVLREIRARHGKFAVTGNHDYGDYSRWASPAGKAANLQSFCRGMEACGFRMLNNENYPLVVAGDTLFLCGVENCRRPPWPCYGDAARALEGTGGHVTVMLSHDPAYWRETVRHYPVALTLSGHTHAMQVGVRVRGHQWSPARYFFPEYNGLYAHEGRQLYVSRGVGYLGFPGRVGLRPEITLLELKAF
jgi:predicted MPP superfamily phosphohydrolase